MVERKLPKLKTRVRFPSLAPKNPPKGGFFYEQSRGRTREEGLESEAKDAEGGP